MASIQLFAVVVPCYDKGIDFYVKKLGFDLIEDDDRGNGKRWVVVKPPGGGCGILLAKAVNERQSAAIGNQTGGRVGFFLATDEFERDYQKFVANGVHFEEKPRYEEYGTVAVFQDDFGNRWDLLQRKEW